jgi:hypothetical protein
MKHQIRKVESITIYRSTCVVELDDNKFRKLEDTPYTGNSQEEFMTYLASLDFEFPPEDLDDKTASKLMEIKESEWTEYSNSCEHGSDVWLQIGEADESYRKTGGFRVDDQIESNY